MLTITMTRWITVTLFRIHCINFSLVHFWPGAKVASAAVSSFFSIIWQSSIGEPMWNFFVAHLEVCIHVYISPRQNVSKACNFLTHFAISNTTRIPFHIVSRSAQTSGTCINTFYAKMKERRIKSQHSNPWLPGWKAGPLTAVLQPKANIILSLISFDKNWKAMASTRPPSSRTRRPSKSRDTTTFLWVKLITVKLSLCTFFAPAWGEGEPGIVWFSFHKQRTRPLDHCASLALGRSFLFNFLINIII